MSGPVTAEQVREVLNGITDPCSVAASAPAGLVDMGLVSSVEVVPGGHVEVRLRLTDGLCMMGAVFVAEARERLAPLVGPAGVRVSLEAGSVWTPEDMTEAYRTRLGHVRRSRRRAAGAA